MLTYSIIFDTKFKKAMFISFLCHILFLNLIYFTFSKPNFLEKETSIFFFSSILSSADLNLSVARKALDIYGQDTKTLNPRRDLKLDTLNLNTSYLKPVYPALEISGYAKQLNKFVVIDKKPGIDNKVEPRSIEPAKWQKLELKLKSE